MTYFKYLADLEPVEVCMMIGTCMDSAMTKLQVGAVNQGGAERGQGKGTGVVLRCCPLPTWSRVAGGPERDKLPPGSHKSSALFPLSVGSAWHP